MTWTTIEDGVVITSKMSDEQVYARCKMFGAERLIEALEKFLDSVN